ncbi:MAG: delta-60 repeat domain-containing protein, partial [Verrucomicrobiales bacterium]|nr:delta-60 repeat domain-containing protein [Verrucomicrobiales bacterium]
MKHLLLFVAVIAYQSQAQLKPGSLDLDFDVGEIRSSRGLLVSGWPYVIGLTLAADNKIYIGGHLTSVNGVERNGLARLNPDGSLDSSFTPPTSPEIDAHDIQIQPDGRIL